MSQLDLFDKAPPMVRRSDPQTSRVAAKSVDANARQRECLQALSMLGGVGTAEDVSDQLAATGFRRDKNCCAKRLGELEHAGRVRRAGTSIGRSGRHQTLWRLL